MQILKKILSTFRKRHNSTLPLDIPSSFYVGQPYVEDQNKIECIIEANFLFPATIELSEFYFHGSKVLLYQEGSVLKVRFTKSISEKLWQNIKKSHTGEGFILTYVNRLMPEINRRLLENRYLNGHLLSKTFSILDAVAIFLIHKDKYVRLQCPGSISNFPPSAELAKEKDAIYLRDYIDAMHSYFKNDYDDCIRRVITSTENLFKLKKLKGDNGVEFLNILYNNLDTRISSSKIIADNISFIYKLRNKIVHDKFRIKSSDGWVCKKAIGSLNYLLQRLCNDNATAIYVHTLAGQFLMLQNFVGEGRTLDDIEKIDRNAPVDPSCMIETPAELDDWMFASLKITDKEKSLVFKK